MNKSRLIFALFLLIITIFALYPSTQNDFVSYCDDDGYITNNISIQSLSWKNTKLIFSSLRMGNYHPLTDLSWSIDYALFGLSAKGFHNTNLLLHLCNTLLLFLLLFRLTQNNISAFFGALIFGVHPMHVESVAWISERKDVLYTFFYLLALIVYTSYISTKKKVYFLLTSLLFILSLLSKSAAITLPLALWLLDFLQKRKITKQMILEKAPLLVIAAFFSLLAIESQRIGGGITNLSVTYDLADRALFVCYAIVFYLFSFLAPIHLSAMHLYPTETEPLALYFYASPIIIVALIFLAKKYIYTKKNADFKRYFSIGILFFLINIAPVLQFIPIGRAIVAERYTYISYIGLILIFIAAIQLLKSKKQKQIANIVICIWLAAFTMQSQSRTKIWKNSTSLINDVIEKSPNNSYGYFAKGDVLQKEGDLQEALVQYTKAIELREGCYDCYTNRADLYSLLGQNTKAISDLEQALQIRPYSTALMLKKANEFIQLTQYKYAVTEINRAIEINPYLSDGYLLLGNVYFFMENYRDAANNYTKAIALEHDALAYYNRGNAHYGMKKINEAIDDYTMAIRLSPTMGKAYYNRGTVYFNTEQQKNACTDWQLANKYGHLQAKEALVNYCK